MPRAIVLLLVPAVVGLLPGPAAAQRFVYAVTHNGPAFSTSRCAITPGGCPSRLHLIDVDQARVIGTMPSGHQASDGIVAASGDGRYLAWSIGFGGSLLIFDRETQTFSSQFLGGFSPSEPRVAGGASGSTFFAYRPGQPPLRIVKAGSSIDVPIVARSVATGPDGSLAYVSTDAGVAVVDVSSGAVTSSIALAGSRGWDLAMSPDGAAIFVLRSAGAASTDPATLFRVDPATLKITGQRTVLMAGDLKMAPDGQSLWLSDGNLDVPSPSQPAARSVRSDTLADLLAVTIPGAIRSLALTGDGARLVVTGFNSHTIVDTAAATIVASLATPENGIVNVAALPAAAACVFLVAPTGFQLEAAGGTVQTGVPAPAGCGWGVTTNDGWLTAVAPLAAVGAGSVTISVAANASSQVRTGSVVVAGQTVTITQAASPQTPGTPGPPQGLAASVLSGAFAMLSWSAPAAGPLPTGYIVEAGSVPGGQDLVVAPVGLLTTVTGGPLAPGPYYVRVRAVNAAGSGPASADVSFVIQPIPSQPFINGLAWTTPQSGRLSWGFNPARRMRISVGRTPDAMDVGAIEIINLNLSLEVSATDLAAGRYFIRMTAVNDDGVSGPTSGPAEVWFGSACSAAPQGPASLTVSGGPFVTASATTASFQPFTAYRFYVGTAPGAGNVAVVDSPVSPASGFLPSGTYYFRAAFVNACGVSAPTQERVLTIP